MFLIFTQYLHWGLTRDYSSILLCSVYLFFFFFHKKLNLNERLHKLSRGNSRWRHQYFVKFKFKPLEATLELIIFEVMSNCNLKKNYEQSWYIYLIIAIGLSFRMMKWIFVWIKKNVEFFFFYFYGTFFWLFLNRSVLHWGNEWKK